MVKHHHRKRKSHYGRGMKIEMVPRSERMDLRRKHPKKGAVGKHMKKHHSYMHLSRHKRKHHMKHHMYHHGTHPGHATR